MFLSFQSALCEAVVESEIQHRVSQNDFRLAASFRKKANTIYENVPPRKREAAFSILYPRYFEELGYPDKVKNILGEFAGNEEIPSECLLVRTLREEEESAQISEDGTRLGIQIRAETLLNLERCAYLLRHELTHILDTLDPAFGYEPSRPLSEVSPSEESLFRDRYRTLWDLSVDGRLERKGHLPEGLREQRVTEFRTLFPSLSESAAKESFSVLWNDPRPSDAAFRQMVKGAATLCSVLNLSTYILDEEEYRAVFGPGSLCPLCLFPTHEWAEATEHLSRLVRAEFPGWEAAQGICTQCANRFLFTATPAINSPDPDINGQMYSQSYGPGYGGKMK